MWLFFRRLMHPFSNPVTIGIYTRMPRLKNWKKAFKAKVENRKQAIVLQVIFISKIKLKKYIFSRYQVLFEPLLGLECAYVCHKLRTGKEGIYRR